MTDLPRIYLDNAATSWPKPTSVSQAVDDYLRNIGAAAGRGAYASAQAAGQIVDGARQALRRLVNAPQTSELVFTYSGTDSLNLCLLGSLRPGDHVVTSVAEHNSVLRPLTHLRESRDVTVDFVDCNDDGTIKSDQVKTAIHSKTRMVAVTHASNVTAAIQPIAEISAICRAANVWLLVDAAQTAGHVPIDLTATHVDFLAASGHKGLLGPSGTGFVCLTAQVTEQTTPLRFGGTGTESESEQQPDSGTARFEAGNLNAAGLAGLRAGVDYVHSQWDEHTQRCQAQSRRVLEGLAEISGVRVVGPKTAEKRVGLVSFVIDGYDCHTVAAMLDASFGIQVRAGLHCAPRMHRRMELTGTVRASWGPFTTDDELTQFLSAVSQICSSTTA